MTRNPELLVLLRRYYGKKEPEKAVFADLAAYLRRGNRGPEAELFEAAVAGTLPHTSEVGNGGLVTSPKSATTSGILTTTLARLCREVYGSGHVPPADMDDYDLNRVEAEWNWKPPTASDPPGPPSPPPPSAV